MTAYRISLAPPKLESRQYHVGVASARVLVDTPDSQVVDLNPEGRRRAQLAGEPAGQPDGLEPREDDHRAGRRGAGRQLVADRAFRDRLRPRPTPLSKAAVGELQAPRRPTS